MKQLITTGIILSRTDYGEADRILTFLTPDYGKLRLVARGVRKLKSKLAGGIELFSISNITFIQGKGDLGTLVSTRLETHYGHIVKQLERTMLGYDLIKQLNKVTEDQAGEEYFQLLQTTFDVLDSPAIPVELVRLWFNAQLLVIAGHTPNLQTDVQGNALQPNQAYNFDIEAMTFQPHSSGRFQADDIKFLRLIFGETKPAVLAKVGGQTKLTERLQPIVRLMSQQMQ